MQPPLLLPELRHLRSFSILAEELHFGRAAQRAHLTQSGLTHQLHRLEDVLGARLFERSTRHVELTPVGENFLVEARAILDHIEAATRSAQKMSARSRTVFSIGYSPRALQTPMSQMLQVFRKRFDDVDVVLHEHWSDELEHQLSRGNIDVAFMIRRPDDLPRGTLTIWNDQVLACLPKGHGLTQRDLVTFQDLRGEALILAPESSAPRTYRAFIEACEAQGFQPNIVEEAAEMPKVMALAAAGVGIGFTPASMAGVAPAGVVLRPLGPPLEFHSIVLAWLEPIRDPIVRQFVAIARNTIDHLAD